MTTKKNKKIGGDFTKKYIGKILRVAPKAASSKVTKVSGTVNPTGPSIGGDFTKKYIGKTLRKLKSTTKKVKK